MMHVRNDVYFKTSKLTEDAILAYIQSQFNAQPQLDFRYFERGIAPKQIAFDLYNFMNHPTITLRKLSRIGCAVWCNHFEHNILRG